MITSSFKCLNDSTNGSPYQGGLSIISGLIGTKKSIFLDREIWHFYNNGYTVLKLSMGEGFDVYSEVDELHPTLGNAIRTLRVQNIEQLKERWGFVWTPDVLIIDSGEIIKDDIMQIINLRLDIPILLEMHTYKSATSKNPNEVTFEIKYMFNANFALNLRREEMTGKIRGDIIKNRWVANNITDLEIFP